MSSLNKEKSFAPKTGICGNVRRKHKTGKRTSLSALWAHESQRQQLSPAISKGVIYVFIDLISMECLLCDMLISLTLITEAPPSSQVLTRAGRLIGSSHIVSVQPRLTRVSV